MKKLKSSDDLNSIEKKGMCRDSDSNRRSSYRGYYYKSDHVRKGLSSSHSSRYNPSVNEGRDNFRSIRRRPSFHYESFDHRKGFDNYYTLERGGGLLYGEDHIHRSESFHMPQKDFPKGFRSEREGEGGVSSWAHFERNKEYDGDGKSSGDSAEGDRSGFEDRVRVLIVAKSPSWSKEYCSYRSKSSEIKKSEEVMIQSGECSEMEEGELEPDTDPEPELELKNLNSNNDNHHDQEGVMTYESELKSHLSSSLAEEENILERERFSAVDVEISGDKEGGCDGKLESVLSEIRKDVDGNLSHDCQEKLLVVVEGDKNPITNNCASDNVEEYLPLREEVSGFNHENLAENSTDIQETNNIVSLENRSFGAKVAADELTLVLEDRGKTVASSSSYMDPFVGEREEESMEMVLKNSICPSTDLDWEVPSSRGFELFSCQKLEHADQLKEKNLTLEPLELSLSLPNVLLPISVSDTNIQLISTQAETSYVSMSISGSQQLSHNPSCSITQNSFDNYELSVGSRPTPYNFIPKETPLYQRKSIVGMTNDLFSPLGSSEVLDRQLSIGSLETLSEHSKERMKILNESNNDSDCVYIGSTNPKYDMRKRSDFFEALITLMVSEPIHVTARKFHEMSQQSLARLREGVSEILPQKSPHKWSDVTMDMLLKCPKPQLEIMVSLKTGLRDFLQQHDTIPSSVLAEIILDMRCRNINCKHLLPVDGCECKMCSLNKGFCNSCMCIICSKFDNASNTCSWVGCDVCLHWCHTDCSLRESLISNGNTASGVSEMQFYCGACGHPSEMFGFIKEIFQSFAKTWPRKTLIKELEYVMRIFWGSVDIRGKQLYDIAEQMISKLANGSEFEVHDPYNSILSFLSGCGATTFSKTVHPDSVFPVKASQPEPKDPVFNELDSIIRIKEEEAKLFEARANEARSEANGLIQIVIAKRNKIDEEFTSRIKKLGLLEAEKMRKKKLEQLQVLERSHCEYFSMKLRMEADIKNLLLKMEATKKNHAL